MDETFREEDDLLDDEKEIGGKGLAGDDEPESLDELLEKEFADDGEEDEEDSW